ncbi:hypothetical protein ZIOFF_009633 [Zingiber officinale]|uniref:ATP-citrate synthase ATP-grasp domain-containing protein n=1 Tax=Zingiber officinale TaxID=94328 RepID=A0A8J5LXC3_ZINOF|nr:hypothetical protein ZIOFF_009633 [Zingiber officinale]
MRHHCERPPTPVGRISTVHRCLCLLSTRLYKEIRGEGKRSEWKSMARKKIREYDSKRLLKEHLKRHAGIDLRIRSAQVTEETDFNELANVEPWLSSEKLVVKPDMLFGKRGKSGLVALNLDLAQAAQFVKERLGKEVEMEGCRAPITTFIIEPFVPHDQEYYLSIVSERLGCTISFSECGGIEIEENWDKVKTVYLPTEKPMTADACAPLIATLQLEVRGTIGDFIRGVFAVFQGMLRVIHLYVHLEWIPHLLLSEAHILFMENTL